MLCRIGFITLWIVAAFARCGFADLEGIAFSISSYGGYGNFRDALDLSETQMGKFRGFRVDSTDALKDIYPAMRRELHGIIDEAGRKAWSEKHGPMITQINYDLWQEACELLETEERIQDYYRGILQDYLRNGRDVRCIASLLGVELTFPQIEAIQAKLKANKENIDGLMVPTRRKIEAEHFAKMLPGVDFNELRGEEFPLVEDRDDHRFPFDREPKDLMIRIANKPEVLKELKVNMKTKEMLAYILKTVPAQDSFGFPAGLGRPVLNAPPVGNAQLEEQRNEPQEPEGDLKKVLKSHLSPEQYERLRQIVIQRELRRFQYHSVLSIANGEEKNVDPRKLQFEISQLARQEFELAHAQLSLDLNAKSFDEVLGTTLATSIGRLVAFSGSHFGMNDQGLTPVKRFGDRYGAKPSTSLKIPDALTQPPAEKLVWDVIKVPEGWDLEEAQRNLQEKNDIGQQLVDASRKMRLDERALHKEMADARKAGDRDKLKELNRKRAKESGLQRFDVRRQFREAAKIAQEDAIKARRIVKQLGGDPGEFTEWQHQIH